MVIAKPAGCKGCPFYGDGQGFVPDAIVPGRAVMIYAQNPGEYEEHGRRCVSNVEGRWVTELVPPQPMIGPTGWTMERRFLPLAGLTRDDVNIANTLRCRVKHTNELPPVASVVVREAIQHCTRAHWAGVPVGTRLIVAEGAYALWALTGEGLERGRTLSAWRGSLLPLNPPPRPTKVFNHVYTPTGTDVPVLPTFHLASLWKDPSAKHPVQRDWRKVAQVLHGRWPAPIPAIEPLPPAEWPAVAAFDTEYVVDTGALLRYSLAWRTPEGTPVVHVVEAADAVQVPTPPRVRLVLHNAPADVPYLPAIVGDVPIDLEDTMDAHATLWPGRSSDEDESQPGMAHNLNFLGSIYARTNRWKHLVHTNPTVYAGGDALGTWDVWVALMAEMARDPQAEQTYRRAKLPTIPIRMRAHRDGLRVNTAKARDVLTALETRMDDAEARAQAEVGWPLNIGSPLQVAFQLYQVEHVQQKGVWAYRPTKVTA